MAAAAGRGPAVLRALRRRRAWLCRRLEQLVLVVDDHLRRDLGGVRRHRLLAGRAAHQRGGVDQPGAGADHLPQHLCRRHLRRGRVHLCVHQDHHHCRPVADGLYRHARRQPAPRAPRLLVLAAPRRHEGVRRHRQHRPLPGPVLHARQRRLLLRRRRAGRRRRRRGREPAQEHPQGRAPRLLAYHFLLRARLARHQLARRLRRPAAAVGAGGRRPGRRRVALGHRHPERQHQGAAVHHQRRHPDVRHVVRQRLPVHRLALPLRARPERPGPPRLPDLLQARRALLRRRRHRGRRPADLPVGRLRRCRRCLQLVPEHHHRRRPLHLVLHLHLLPALLRRPQGPGHRPQHPGHEEPLPAVPGLGLALLLRHHHSLQRLRRLCPRPLGCFL